MLAVKGHDTAQKTAPVASCSGIRQRPPLGKDAGGLSATTVGRLKEAWSEEHARMAGVDALLSLRATRGRWGGKPPLAVASRGLVAGVLERLAFPRLPARRSFSTARFHRRYFAPGWWEGRHVDVRRNAPQRFGVKYRFRPKFAV